LVRANTFYKKHGGKTIILARFMPIIRTFAPVVAGIGTMEYKTFLTYNVIGAALWAIGMPIAGYFLGRVIPDIDKYLIPIVVFIVLISIAPGVYETTNTVEKRGKLFLLAKKFILHTWYRVRRV
ncbi:MAG: VTT domain-containing protein, partial [Candidatus Levybacteria bacterium]|nr:VTT domain-containing protein [Candidatus Levybacteria bacterium]